MPDIFCCAVIYHRMDYIVFILFDISGVKFWPGLDSGELKGGQWVGVGG